MRVALTVLAWLGTVITLAVSATALGVLGNLIGANNGSPFVALVVRTTFVLLALAITVAFVVARSDGTSGAVWLSAAVVAYLLVPLTWDGSLLFGNQFLPWWGAAIFDLCIWTLVALAVVEFESSLARRRARTAPVNTGFHQPYGGQW
ncbi:hypothetical protein [Kribbia dieselivorans]|uniref:hypothetical protein n=1 Tax=Kribbia dieselivorans TaxID=331526 RepID=UPI000838C3A8|nr:hypothetical protein [Kribbia dieselivorans]